MIWTSISLAIIKYNADKTTLAPVHNKQAKVRTETLLLFCFSKNKRKHLWVLIWPLVCYFISVLWFLLVSPVVEPVQSSLTRKHNTCCCKLCEVPSCPGAAPDVCTSGTWRHDLNGPGALGGSLGNGNFVVCKYSFCINISCFIFLFEVLFLCEWNTCSCTL